MKGTFCYTTAVKIKFKKYIDKKIVKRGDKMKLNQAINVYLDNLIILERSPETIKTYKKNLNLLSRYLSSRNNCEVYAEDILAEDIEDYLSKKCNSDKYSSAYRFNKIAIFKCFFSFCYMNEYCKRDVAKEFGQVKKRVKERIYLTGNEFEKLTTGIMHPTIQAVVQTMYYAGLRINECIKLTLDDIDFNRNCILVKMDKTKHNRTIPINYKLKSVLLEYLESWRDNTKETENFFATKSGRVSQTYVNMELKSAVKRMGLNKNVTCHIMRHSFASNLIANGVDIYKIQLLLGHTSLKTTSLYLHTNMNELKKAVNLIN
jgi:integrase/recombinase XerD